MGQEMMKLIELIGRLAEYDDELTIYAEKPWRGNSKALVILEPDDGGLPQEAEKNKLEYFLEIFVANEFLEGWNSKYGKNSTKKETCDRLISYAKNDA